jgi:2-polyprenyl-3-methyl-5-hydroxy-6-metoxy-1,4-benzoquinol methylase
MRNAMNPEPDFHNLPVTDFSVSGESFVLIPNESGDLLATSPRPSIADLAKYYESPDYISHTDGKRSWFERLYHLVKSVAISNKLAVIGDYKHGGNLLDIGAGTGDFLAAAKRKGWKVSGSEPSIGARAMAESKNVTLAADTAAFPDQSFDVITMWHVLEHVYDPEWQVRELKRLLKPGGRIFIAVPNFKSADARHYGEFWAAYDVPRHLWHFSTNSIKKLFAAEGMNVEKVCPMHFDAYYVSLLSEKYKHGRMRILSGFFNGLLSNMKGRKTGEFSSHIYVIKSIPI